MPKVLFLDDEQPLLTAIGRVLRAEPYEVITTTSPERALEIVAEGVDVVVTDERMPRMNGGDFLEMVRRAAPDVIRIMLTGETSLAVTSRLIENGGLYRFLGKPVDNDELRRVLLQALHHREMQRARG